MCCFSGRVEHVSGTKIFARNAGNGRQYLVYEMKFEAKTDLAMILPLPVPARSMEGDVRFIDLSGYDRFFVDMKAGFPESIHWMDLSASAFVGAVRPTLSVVEVGCFEASFVPTVNDFERLDARFRLPSETWSTSLPQYEDWGFAVFKLKPGRRKVHPMAFDFPRRRPDLMFFPTLHIHDGEVHEVADFDHMVYMQPPPSSATAPGDWRQSSLIASAFMDIKKAQSLVDAGEYVYRCQMNGRLKNRDIWVQDNSPKRRG